MVIASIRSFFGRRNATSDVTTSKNAKPVPADAGDNVSGFMAHSGYFTSKLPFNLGVKEVLKDKDITDEVLNDPEKAGEIIEQLVKNHSILQGVMSTFLTLSSNPVKIIAYDKDDDTKINIEATKKARRVYKELCRPSDVIDPKKGTISYRMTESELHTSIKTMLLVRGGVYPYIDYREDGTIDFRLLDPLDLKINYYMDEKGNIDPCLIECYQYSKKGFVGMKIQKGLFKASFMKNPFTLVDSSPLLAAIRPIMILEKFTEQLMDMITVAGFPMIQYQVDLEKFMLTVSKGKTIDETNKILHESIAYFQENLKKGNHKTVHIIPDWLVPRVLNENASILKADLSQIIDLLTQFVEVSMNLPGTALGTGAEGVNTASVETLLTTKSVNYLNGIVSDVFQNILEYILKVKYNIDDVFITFKFDEMLIRTNLDSAGMSNVKQTIIANDLKMGMISPEEASIQQTGKLPYDKSTVKSHIGLEVKTIESKTQIQPGSGPVDRVANPTGTEARKSATKETSK